jgi:hypothetical protein
MPLLQKKEAFNPYQVYLGIGKEKLSEWKKRDIV